MSMAKTLEIACTGYSIVADWYEGKGQDHVLLILPGFSSSRKRKADVASTLVDSTGASALVIDYSGHGDSPFKIEDTRPAQHFLEVTYAFEWIKTNYPTAKISVIASSYGGFLATRLTKYRTFENLVLCAPAIYKPTAFYDLWSVRLADEDAYRKSIREYRQDTSELLAHPLLDRASEFTGRTIVVVHENDEVIPRQTTDMYIHAFNADSFIANDFAHAVSHSPISSAQLQEYEHKIADWLGKSE